MHQLTRILGWIALLFLQVPLLAASPPGPAGRVWDESRLAGWALPAVGNLPPHHVRAEEYYAGQEDNLRTYPVYHPDREPKGNRLLQSSLTPRPVVPRSA